MSQVSGIVFVIVFVYVIVFVFFCQAMSPHHSDQMSQSSQVSGVALCVFSKRICLCLCHCLCLCICICLCHCLFVGQVMSPHHSDRMSQRSQVSRVALWRCFLNVFVFVIVFVFVFVFVIVFFWVRSSLLITLIKCLKGHKSLGSLSEGVLKMYLSLSLSLSLYLYWSLSFCWSGHVPSSLWSHVS